MIQVNKKGVLLSICSFCFLTVLYFYSLYPAPRQHFISDDIRAECVHPSNVEQLITTLNTSTPHCFTPVAEALNRIYVIEITNDHVEVPKEMQDMVMRWFKGDEKLYRKFQNPVTMIVTNKLQSETTSVNPLRSQRPKPAGSDRAYEAVMKEISDSKPGCNFCATNLTLEDTFGRVYWKKKHMFTAENAFRFYDHVGLIIPADIHNYMDIDYQTFQTMFTYTAITWFGNIQDGNPGRTHPVLLWDILGKAGASQVHPHVQMFLGRGFYPGKLGQIDNAASRYAQKYPGRGYLQDMVDIHIALGLGLRHKSAAMIVPLHATKDHDIMIIGTDNLYDWTWLYYLVHRTYIEELKVYCFSTGMALPSDMIGKGRGGGNLLVAHVGSRGDCTSRYNDVSSLELYSINSISTDFYTTMEAFRNTYEKYKAINRVPYENI